VAVAADAVTWRNVAAIRDCSNGCGLQMDLMGSRDVVMAVF